MRQLLASAVLLVFAAAFAQKAAADPVVDYEREVKPLLLHKCAPCHGVLQQQAGLRLDAGVFIHGGGDSGAAVHSGDGAASLLIERVTEADVDLRMPPEGEGEPLTPAQIKLLSRWIDQGAIVPADEMIPEDPAEHWSYHPPHRPELPAIKSTNWIRSPVDTFIAAKHEQQGLSPRSETPRERWLRRVFLDLVGIPPTRDQLHAFLADDSPAAYEKVVDQLLSRADYGERWGRHWMDVWRYSDWYGSRGINEIRYSQRHIWRWRDWIVESLCADKPYDQMLVEMLAGDEVAPSDPDVLRATGFLGRNWYKFDRNVWMFETVEHTSQAFLAVTMRCARCHDHKYDPISQQDYYRFRAFFEPYDVRTDPLVADAPKEKDATLGMVLADGVARVFDRDADAKTFLFRRGDDRSPDESRPLSPGVPAALGNVELTIEPIVLPADAYYPSLRPQIASGLIEAAEKEVIAAQRHLNKTRREAAAAERAVADFSSRSDQDEPTADAAEAGILTDDFAQRSDLWQIVSGNWLWQDGKLTETSVGNFATVVSSVELPQDFQARLVYRTLEPGAYRSVGFSFDYIDQGHSQDVYTSTNDSAPSIQAFHRIGGKQEYPQAGIVKTPLAVGEITTVEVIARGQQLSISLNGQHKLDYVMPIARRAGKFALWVHSGAAEFLEVDVRTLLPTLEDLQRQQTQAANQIALAESQLRIAEAEVASVRARVAAERAKYMSAGAETTAPAPAAIQASRAEAQTAIAKAQHAVLLAEQHRVAVVAAAPADADSQTQAAVSAQQSEADQKLAEAGQSLAAARAAFETPSGNYAPLGDIFPSSSTGRRTALARWIASPENPRTARVAVNHIWARHFGEPLVASVANFGLSGDPPSHPELLDWLAAELIDNGWQMKPLHRMIVLSATYRQSSETADAGDCAVRDPENRYLWKMNSRRMEAEVVRDSVLATAVALDCKLGGREIAEHEGQSVTRRSLYFRNTPNEKMPLLETFDAPNPNECYRRQESVVPHQALALLNSALALEQSRLLAQRLSDLLSEDGSEPAGDAFIVAAWETVLNRSPSPQERAACRDFLAQSTAIIQAGDGEVFSAAGQTVRRDASPLPHQRARENLIHVLFSHNDFVTIR